MGQLIETVGRVTRVQGRTITLDDGSGELRLYLTALTGIPVPHLAPGDEVQATGIIRRYRSEPELHPRFGTDLVLPQTSSLRSVPTSPPAGRPSPAAPAASEAPPVVSPRPAAVLTPTPPRTRLAALSTLAPPEPEETLAVMARTATDLTFGLILVGVVAGSGAMLLLSVWMAVRKRRTR
jgi:hypothetical protein